MSDSNTAQDWIDDLTDPDDEDGSPSLFEDNFRKMVEDDDLDSMTVSTLENQIDRVDDPELLATAIETDGRTTAEEVYKKRLDEIETPGPEESEGEETLQADDAEGSDEPTVDPEKVDEAKEETEDSVDDIVDSINDDGEDEVESEVVEEAEELAEEMAEEDDDREAAETPSEDEESAADPAPPEPDEAVADGTGSVSTDPSGDLPDVDVSSLAPNAVDRTAAADAEKERTLLVWGPEGTGKSHVAHSAPEPIAYIDTEGKADELAEKFDKQIFYWQPSDYKEAKAALEEAEDLLAAYYEEGVRGTLVVDSMSVMWEWAQIDYAKFAYQTENLSEVNFKSALQGEKDWSKIKARHNEEFRDRILGTPYHVVFTAGEKEDYNDNFEARMVPDGEKHNKYAVKDVVRVRVDEATGKTAADLRKAARTRYSFVGLEWPDFEKIYDAIGQIAEAEQDPEPVDLDDWEFGVVEGQPVQDPSEGSGDDGGDDS